MGMGGGVGMEGRYGHFLISSSFLPQQLKPSLTSTIVEMDDGETYKFTDD